MVKIQLILDNNEMCVPGANQVIYTLHTFHLRFSNQCSIGEFLLIRKAKNYMKIGLSKNMNMRIFSNKLFFYNIYDKRTAYMRMHRNSYSVGSYCPRKASLNSNGDVKK